MTLFILPTIIYCLKNHDKIEEIDRSKNCFNNQWFCLVYDYLTKSHDLNLEPWIMSAFHTNPIIEKQANIEAVFWATVFNIYNMGKRRYNPLSNLRGFVNLSNKKRKTAKASSFRSNHRNILVNHCQWWFWKGKCKN